MKRKQILLAAAAVTNILLFLMLHQFLGFYFETNDDKCITEILTGTYSGGPEAHTVYINYLLSLLWAGLYRVTAAVPWYGGGLILLEWIACTSIHYAVLRTAKTWTGAAVRQAGYLCFFFSCLYTIANVQYTMVAALLAAAGYFYLLTRRAESGAVPVFFLLELMGLLLRSKAMLMVQPLGLGALAGCLLVWKDLPAGKRLRLLRNTGIALFLCLGVAGLGNMIGYSGEGWREYDSYNQCRTQLFDYYGTPNSEDIEELLEKYQVSRENYDAFRHYIMLEDTIPISFLQELVTYQKAHSEVGAGLGESLRKSWQSLRVNDYQRYNRVTLAAYLLLLAAVLASGRWMLLAPAAALVCSRTAVWTYLCWKGRMPLRVSLPLLLCETLLLLALTLEAYRSVNKRNWLMLLTGAGTALFLIQAMKAGRQQVPVLREEHAGQQVFVEGLRDLQEYCGQNPENRYLMEADSMMHFRGSALETGIYQQPNYLVSGNWYSYSPVMKEKLNTYIKKGEYEELYAITYKWEEGRTDWMIPYLNTLFGGTFEPVEEITVSHGGTYLVYRLMHTKC